MRQEYNGQIRRKDVIEYAGEGPGVLITLRVVNGVLTRLAFQPDSGTGFSLVSASQVRALRRLLAQAADDREEGV